MPPRARAAASATQSPHLVLLCGDEDFQLKQRARQLYTQWCGEVPGDHEIIDANVTNSGEALRAIARLREAIQTLPFFGGGKVIWFQNCNFLGEDRSASAQDVVETLADLAGELQRFSWGPVRLLISSGKIDKRRVFFKTLSQAGTVEQFEGLSPDDRDWAERAGVWVEESLERRGKTIDPAALNELVLSVGPNLRLLENEAEKLSLYVGSREKIDREDIATVSIQNRQAKAFALADALGDRNLPALMSHLERELWSVRQEAQRNEIGLLYGLISKVRAMLFMKSLLKEGLVRADNDYRRFCGQLEKIPADRLPEPGKQSPMAMNPYVLFRAAGQSGNYSNEELVRAMEVLLTCNQKLISSTLDSDVLLQQALAEIVGTDKKPAGSRL